MNPRPAPTPPATARIFLAAGLIAGATLLVYANSLAAPFIFDDLPAIRDNASIRQLATALFPPATAGSAAGRPVVNLSFALNHALGGDNPAGYHALNLLIHAGAALALFGFVRRTLLLPILRDRWGAAALPVAFWTALLWAVHPLLTESVTCVAQRSESLAGLWFLLMFYCLARAAEPGAPGRWRAGAFAACLLGVFTKEVMVAGPVLALFYHLLLVDGSWRETFARRGKLLALLALTWVPLALLVWSNGPRHGAGFNVGISSWEYALTQCRAVALYLELSLWPHPLVLDYGTDVNRYLAEVWPQALLLTGLLTTIAAAAWRRQPAAFAGLWFITILAPSSSVLPLFTQTIAEHRMYLPLAAVIVLVVAGGHRLAGRHGWLGLGLVALVFAGLTVRRNADYASPLSIWSDTVAKAPNNARAQTNLGNALDEAGREAEARQAYERALLRDPRYAAAHYNLGNLLARHGRTENAIARFRTSLQLEPNDAHAHARLGLLLVQIGRRDEGVAELLAALKLAPGHALAHDTLVQLGLPPPR